MPCVVPCLIVFYIVPCLIVSCEVPHVVSCLIVPFARFPENVQSERYILVKLFTEVSLRSILRSIEVSLSIS